MLEDNKVKIAYTVVEREKDGRQFWVRVGAAFVNNQATVGIRMLERGFARFLLDDLHRQQIGKDRERFCQRPAFVMARNEAGGVQN